MFSDIIFLKGHATNATDIKNQSTEKNNSDMANISSSLTLSIYQPTFNAT